MEGLIGKQIERLLTIQKPERTYFLQRKEEKMADIFAYEGKSVDITCNNGKTYSGEVKWCARAEDIDEDDDVLAINDVGLLASEIKTIKVI